MKPDRSNYELWLIDWLDGNLDEVRTRQLMDFLDENPDLKEEADSLSMSSLEPDKNASFLKKGLKKTASDLPLSQVEYLSIAYLENDLSRDRQKDLEENISKNPESRKLFEAIQKTRLKPQEHSFVNKRILLKKTPAQKVFRLSVAALSAAAATTVIVVSFLILPKLSEKSNEALAINSTNDTLVIQKGKALTVNSISKDITHLTASQNKRQTSEESFQEVAEEADQQIAYINIDTSSIFEHGREIFIPEKPVPSDMRVGHEAAKTVLAASYIVTREPSYYDPERSRLRKFIASTFREKILKNKVYDDAPLQTYEIAEAGIEGLNKLLGWQMALVKTSDDEGEPTSFYFSSRVLKFNAPVKKSNPPL
jgi:hypothetical protein